MGLLVAADLASGCHPTEDRRSHTILVSEALELSGQSTGWMTSNDGAGKRFENELSRTATIYHHCRSGPRSEARVRMFNTDTDDIQVRLQITSGITIHEAENPRLKIDKYGIKEIRIRRRIQHKSLTVARGGVAAAMRKCLHMTIWAFELPVLLSEARIPDRIVLAWAQDARSKRGGDISAEIWCGEQVRAKVIKSRILKMSKQSPNCNLLTINVLIADCTGRPTHSLRLLSKGEHP